MYDFIVIGGGISGLYIGNYLKNKNKKFLIIENKTRIGGRIKTFKNKDIIYEAGAYRFTNNHIRLTKLISKLGLNKYISEMKDKKKFFLRDSHTHKKYNTSYNLNYNNIIKKLSNIDSKILINNDILTLVSEYYDNETKNFVKDYCGYDNFIENSNAIQLKQHYKLLNSKFYKLNCGFNKITEILFNNIKNETLLGEKLIDIKMSIKNEYQIITEKNIYKCRKIIITIPKENLLEIPFISQNIKYLESVSSSPYLRIFAVYPKEKGKVWFHDINYTVTDNILRKIIPENYETGLIQICYNDNKNAEYMRNIISNGRLQITLHQNLKKIFPNKNIPEPTFLNYHYWKNGNHFWLPLYNIKDIQKYMINPINNLYISGESYSENQAWIEGALETSDKIINLLEKKTIKKTIKKQKLYTIEQVSKHNNKRSAWTIVNNKVYNITSLVNNFKHPGGNVIENAMGKNITNIFNNIGHSNFSKNLLEKFYIGNIKII